MNTDAELVAEAPDQRIRTICRVGVLVAAMLHTTPHVWTAKNELVGHVDKSLTNATPVCLHRVVECVEPAL